MRALVRLFADVTDFGSHGSFATTKLGFAPQLGNIFTAVVGLKTTAFQATNLRAMELSGIPWALSTDVPRSDPRNITKNAV